MRRIGRDDADYPPGLRDLADAPAHRGALAAGLPQVAYLGTGIARTFPPEHAGLAAAIVAGGAMHTLAFARALGRPRFALDAPASGNRQALADGAVALPWDVAAGVCRIRAV